MAQEKAKTPSKKTTKSAKATAPAKPASTPRPRRLKLGSYKSFHLAKKITYTRRKLPAAPKLFWRACRLLVRNWRLFLGIVAIYAALSIIFVGGIGGSGDLASVKSALSDATNGHLDQVSVGLTLFTFLIGSAGTAAGQAAGAYQVVLLLLISLVLIWALRHVYIKETNTHIRDAFYEAPQPLVPFVLVLCVVGLELLPLILGVIAYDFLVSYGILVDGLEHVVCVLAVLLLAVLSLYMVCSSIFALYVVTLPDMTPVKALRSARELVRYRRFAVLRKLLFLPIVLVVVLAVILIPIALFATPVATVALFVVTMLGVPVIISYGYELYRELLL